MPSASASGPTASPSPRRWYEPRGAGPGRAGRALCRHLHRLPDRLHAGRGGAGHRLHRARAGGLRPGRAADLFGDEGHRARGDPVLPVHGLPARAVGHHGAAVQRHPAAAGQAQRVAVPGGADHRHHLRRGHRHRRQLGHAAGRDGRAVDDQERLRRQDVGRRHRRRRHARHPDPAVGDAHRDGPGGGRAGHRPVCRGGAAGADAVGPVHRLDAGALLAQPEPGPGAARGDAAPSRWAR